MKLVKSLLLGTAAGLAAVAGAQAADLPFRKAAPVDYVRVCDWVGKPGYFYIPGTDTCIKVQGEARYEYAFVEEGAIFTPTPFTTLPGGATGQYVPSRRTNVSGFLGRGQIGVDARTQTAYGLLRAFAQIQGTTVSGNENVQFGDTTTNGAIVDRGFIEFAGFTAGRATSFFDFYNDNFNYGAIAVSDAAAELLAYTATFGGGFSATISLENPGSRRDQTSAIAFGNTAVGAVDANGVGSNVTYAGIRYPDAIAQLRYEQSWGAIQIGGAYHDINTSTAAALPTGPVNRYLSKDEAGWAVIAGVNFKLPMLAAGDEVYLQGIYQNGAYRFQDAYGNMNSGGLIRGFQHADGDAVAVGNATNGGYRLDVAEGFSVAAAFHHYFTPQFHDILFGSYEEIGYGNTVKNIDWTRGGLGDASQYKIGNQFVFTPVSNLDIGVEVLYAKLDQTLAHERGDPTGAQARANLAAAIGRPVTNGFLNPDSFQVRLRVNRDF